MMKDNFPTYSVLRCAALEFDLKLGTVKNTRDETQRLSPISLKLLAYLLAHQGEVVSRTELFETIWPNQLVSDDVLTRAVSDIRTQLFRLDSATKFIETLPKRGYRWGVEVHLIETIGDGCKPGQHSVEITSASAVTWHMQHLLKSGFIYLSLAVLLAALLMGILSQSEDSRTVSIAVLPAVADRPSTEAMTHIVDEALLIVLRKNSAVHLLSASAIKSCPHNPFPYFFSEFGAKWVIESRVTDLDGINNIELNLVDARTGIELRSLKFDIVDRTDILLKVAQKLEPDLLVERLSF